MAKSDRYLGVFHGFGVFLSLTQDRAKLKLELTLHVDLLHSLRDTNILKEI